MLWLVRFFLRRKITAEQLVPEKTHLQLTQALAEWAFSDGPLEEILGFDHQCGFELFANFLSEPALPVLAKMKPPNALQPQPLLPWLGADDKNVVHLVTKIVRQYEIIDQQTKAGTSTHGTPCPSLHPRLHSHGSRPFGCLHCARCSHY